MLLGRADVCDNGVVHDVGGHKRNAFGDIFSNNKQKGQTMKSKTVKESGNAPAVEWKKNNDGDWEGYINGIKRLCALKDKDGWHTYIDVSPQGCMRSRIKYSSAKAAKCGVERIVKWLREIYG